MLKLLAPFVAELLSLCASLISAMHHSSADGPLFLDHRFGQAFYTCSAKTCFLTAAGCTHGEVRHRASVRRRMGLLGQENFFYGPARGSVNEVCPVAHGRAFSGDHDTFSIICI